jgi:hypothetical protein
MAESAPLRTAPDELPDEAPVYFFKVTPLTAVKTIYKK